MTSNSQIRCQTFLKTIIVSLKEKLKQLFTLEGYAVYKIKLKLYIRTDYGLHTQLLFC